MSKVLVLNGPNLNLLGTREPQIYGNTTLNDIAARLQERGRELGTEVECRQTNHEGQLIDWLQEARLSFNAVIINAGGYTHTSVALRDAVAACPLPVIEVHISNIFSREPFRHHSYLSPVAAGVICGLGPFGYVIALEAALQLSQ